MFLGSRLRAFEDGLNHKFVRVVRLLLGDYGCELYGRDCIPKSDFKTIRKKYRTSRGMYEVRKPPALPRKGRALKTKENLLSPVQRRTWFTSAGAVEFADAQTVHCRRYISKVVEMELR